MSKPYRFTWSFSGVSTFENCPMSWAYEKYYKEVPYYESEAAKYGTLVHKALEDRLKKDKPLAKKYAGYERYAKLIETEIKKGARGEFEKRMGITRDGRAVGWFDDEIYGRCAADVLLLKQTKAAIYDYKTGGKIRHKDLDQLRLGCIFTLAYYPMLQEFQVRNIWVKHGKVTPTGENGKFTKRELVEWYEDEYKPRVNRMEKIVEVEAFDYRPNPLCGWCGANRLGLCASASCEYKGD